MTKGLIVIGYQGIGKSSISKNNDKIIDLESSNFKINNERVIYWHIIYCKIAIDLAKQGYIVCVSSHKDVRNEFEMYLPSKDFDIVTIHPILELKEEWLKRLSSRLAIDPIDKNWYAYIGAKNNYENEIKSFYNSAIRHIALATTNYDLKEIINNYKRFPMSYTVIDTDNEKE
jgi:hypothetical protein